MSKRNLEPTHYGFQWGNAEVTRIASDEKGNRWLEIRSERDVVEVRITPSGFLRVAKRPTRK